MATTVQSLINYLASSYPTIAEGLNVFWTKELQKIKTSINAANNVIRSGQLGVTPNSGVPTTSDLPVGGAGVFKDTSGGGVYLAYNDNGTIKKVALT